MKLKVVQPCPALYNRMDYTVHGILQARILEWVAFPFSRLSFQSRDQTQVSHTASVFFTIWTTNISYESVDWIKRVALSNAGGPDQSLEGLNRKKRGISPPVKGTPAWLLSLDISLFLPLDSNWNIGSSWDFKHTGFCIASYVISSPASQPFGLGLKLYHWFCWVLCLLTAAFGS